MTEPRTPLSEEVAAEAARRLIDDAYRPTAYRDDSPIPAIGSSPPVPQPGRPPMSQRAVDVNTTILTVGITSLPVGGMTSLVLYALGHVDPTTLAIAAAAPASLAVPILALSRLAKRAKQAMPDVHHHHYNGPVDQREQRTENRGVWVRNRNEIKG